MRRRASSGSARRRKPRSAFRRRSIGYWTHRLVEKGVPHALEKRFGESVLTFTRSGRHALRAGRRAGRRDRDGLDGGGIPTEHAIRGFHGVTLLLNAAAPTAAILTDVLGFREVAREGALARYRGDAPLGAHVDLREAGDFPRGRMGRGSVHHIAFRAADDAAQAAMAKKLVADHGMHPTEQKDRNYFRSIYFREPNGILFEIATDQPGFAVDEPASELGRSLKLPRVPRAAPRRDRGEAAASARDRVMAEIAASGAPLAKARAAAILLHGRGGSAEDMLGLAEEFGQTDIAYLAPQAPRSTWYPYSFLAPLEQNEPHLSDALGTVGAVLERLAPKGFAAQRVALIGFSQGGCLTLEYVARNAQALRRGRGPERRADRPAGHAARLCGLALRHAGVSRLLRHRLAHSARAGARVARCVHADGRGRHRAHLSRHGPHGERGRDRARHRTADQPRYEPSGVAVSCVVSLADESAMIVSVRSTPDTCLTTSARKRSS